MSATILPRSRGQFVPGHRYSPVTQFRTGERRGRDTEFQAGRPARNWLPVGSVRVRIETHTGLPRAWVKVGEPNVWKKRAVVVWEAEHGALPRGYVVHHKDRNSLNDAPANLEALTRKAHADEHRQELEAAKGRS